MRKILLVLILLMTVFIAACTADNSNMSADLSDEAESSLGDLENLEVERETLEDQTLFEDEDVTLSVEDGTITADVSGLELAELSYAPFSEWCNDGETYTHESDEGSFNAVLMGVTTYNGVEVCQGEHTMLTPTPMGDIETLTNYYITEDMKEIWVVSNTMGQVSESYIRLN